VRPSEAQVGNSESNYLGGTLPVFTAVENRTVFGNCLPVQARNEATPGSSGETNPGLEDWNRSSRHHCSRNSHVSMNRRI
jgi:hypothetical protein